MFLHENYTQSAFGIMTPSPPALSCPQGTATDLFTFQPHPVHWPSQFPSTRICLLGLTPGRTLSFILCHAFWVLASLSTKGECNERHRQVDRKSGHSMRRVMMVVSKGDCGGQEQGVKHRPGVGQGRPAEGEMKRE